MNRLQESISGRGGGPGRGRGPAAKAKNQKAALKRIWSYLKKQRISVISVILLVIVTSVLNILGPFMIGFIIDHYILPLDIKGTIRMAVLLAAVFIASSLLTWLQTFIMIRASLKTIQNLRLELFEKLQLLPIPYFDQKQQGDLMSRMTNDIDNLNFALSQSVIQIVSSILSLVGTALAMLYLNWVLAVVTLFVVPLIVWSTKQIIKRSSVNYRNRQRDLGNLNGYIEETISNSEIVTLFGREQQTIERFKEANERLRHSAMQSEIVSGLLGPTNNLINNLGQGIIIGVGAVMAVHSLVTVGVITSFLTYARQFFRPINQLSNLLNTFQSAIAGAERVFEVLDERIEIMISPNSLPRKPLEGNVEFRNVCFEYVKNQPVLKNISFKARAGEVVALVGPTGSGKTTIVQLLSRFYDATSGEILIDGKNIQYYSLEHLRDSIGVVLQDTYLFSGTVRENIRFGKLDATDEEVEKAAKIAYAHSFIKYLPNQYETMIESGGKNLSQGQRQLIAIARAILKDPDILILDEATSNVDTMTEVHIQKGLNNLMKGRTSFVIAHRLKTIENADQILVIKEGKIVEQGNHDSLMALDGFYAKLQKEYYQGAEI
ncbi:ABC transporter ATP-binding protein [Ureibacillus sp. FSL K6-8385]|uniref:ABC transporter ATP-binding protein n=1 Tax=Ureibacillus terrenus TaxID=118246 RepID=A0A540UX37_9BACL|nr:ABC transporter ATP-binding protein [Ureibacillus terrenus]MED3661774.1 ABC transporter ATP-binding protein [Ureibacillus terrenus]MED3763444.1 ABC transporter ATP-binding protein [Ureibacillus terrenus]TQE89007.1 ABC transporter ATP-binding protein [Ureibacillus terrenus]